jgi:hypothetical protein
VGSLSRAHAHARGAAAAPDLVKRGTDKHCHRLSSGCAADRYYSGPPAPKTSLSSCYFWEGGGDNAMAACILFHNGAWQPTCGCFPLSPRVAHSGRGTLHLLRQPGVLTGGRLSRAGAQLRRLMGSLAPGTRFTLRK